MDNIVFSLTRVSDSITDKVLYRANVQTNGSVKVTTEGGSATLDVTFTTP